MSCCTDPNRDEPDELSRDIKGENVLMAATPHLDLRTGITETVVLLISRRVGRVLRWQSAERAGCLPWSTASIKRLAMMRDWPRGALAWICPAAAELVRQQEALRQELSISPRYFKAYASLLASIQ